MFNSSSKWDSAKIRFSVCMRTSSLRHQLTERTHLKQQFHFLLPSANKKLAYLSLGFEANRSNKQNASGPITNRR